MIEFALVIGVFLWMFFGIIDGGRFVWAYNTVAFACREGTRYAIVRGAANVSPATSAQITTIVQNRAAGLDPLLITVTSTWLPDNKAGSYVQVKVAYTFKPVTPVFTLASYQVTSTSKMAISQ
ncbi:MAG: pilus assembly protein [Acidobacteriota bacterium]|nr:pilus assembly protein [Acidobacteriota bacterium]